MVKEATLRSATDTAPIYFWHGHGDLIAIELEDGSKQMYHREDIRAVLQAGLAW